MKIPLTCLLLILAWPAFCQNQKEPAHYKMGVFPHMPPSKLKKSYAPIAEDFMRHLDKPVRLTTKASYTKFMKELEKEVYDIAFVQPFDYVRAHDRYNYLPLATRDEPLAAVFIVDKNGPIKSISQIKGKRVANPPRVSAVSILTSHALRKLGVNPSSDVERIYGRTHFSCMQMVLIGSADVCGTAARAMKYFKDKKMRERFRIIHESEPIPHALFIVHKRVPEKHREMLKTTIINWGKTRQGIAMLKSANFANFVPIRDSDYNVVRRLNRKPGSETR